MAIPYTSQYYSNYHPYPMRRVGINFVQYYWIFLKNNDKSEMKIAGFKLFDQFQPVNQEKIDTADQQ